MAAISATIVGAAVGSVAARQTAATQVWIPIGGHSERSLREIRGLSDRRKEGIIVSLEPSLARASQNGGIILACCNGWQRPRGESFKGQKKKQKQQPRTVTGALPTEVTAAAAALAVGGALFALRKLNSDAQAILPAKTECESCSGSGLCPTCNGEGFVNKNLSSDAAAKARATAKDAATRYTAGLAKKWNYCATCGGGRGCQSCEGRGWVAQ